MIQRVWERVTELKYVLLFSNVQNVLLTVSISCKYCQINFYFFSGPSPEPRFIYELTDSCKSMQALLRKEGSINKSEDQWSCIAQLSA